MSRIDRDEVLKVARLARLELGEEEVGRLQKDLVAILDYVEKLEELDVSGVEPLAQPVPVELPMRGDRPEKSLTRDDVLANAPEEEEGMFRVPRAVEG